MYVYLTRKPGLRPPRSFDQIPTTQFFGSASVATQRKTFELLREIYKTRQVRCDKIMMKTRSPFESGNESRYFWEIYSREKRLTLPGIETRWELFLLIGRRLARTGLDFQAMHGCSRQYVRLSTADSWYRCRITDSSV